MRASNRSKFNHILFQTPADLGVSSDGLEIYVGEQEERRRIYKFVDQRVVRQTSGAPGMMTSALILQVTTALLIAAVSH